MNTNQTKAPDYKIAIGQRLRSSRINSNLTQEELSDMLKISTKHYGEAERGISGLSVEKLIEVSDILGISLDYLLKGVPSPNTIPCSIIKAYHCCPENKKKHFEKAIKNIAKLITIE